MTILESMLIAIVGVQVVNSTNVRIRPSTVVNGLALNTESVTTNRTTHARKFVVSDGDAESAMAGDVLVEWSPTTGQAWWTYQGLGTGGTEDLNNLTSRYKVVFTPREVAGFTVSQPFLAVRVLPGTRYDNIEAAQASVLSDLGQAGLNAATGPRGFKLINLASALPRSFFVLDGSAARGPDATITSAIWQNGNWTLTVRSPNLQIAKITLKPDFGIKDAIVEPTDKSITSKPGK